MRSSEGIGDDAALAPGKGSGGERYPLWRWDVPLSGAQRVAPRFRAGTYGSSCDDELIEPLAVGERHDVADRRGGGRGVWLCRDHNPRQAIPLGDPSPG